MGCGSSKAGVGKGDARIVFVLGGPGAGKGTQCARIVEKYGYKHLSTGDLLREEVAAGTEIGQKADALMKEGKLVPQEMIVGLLKDAMAKSGAKSFLIDGFPRAMDQDALFEKHIGAADMVLFFDCPEATMEERLLKRGETSGRADDNAEAIKKRFKTFVDQSVPVVAKYEKKGNCVKISAVPGPDDVFAEVAKALDAAEAKWRKEAAIEMAKSLKVPAVPGELPKDAQIVFVLGGPGAGKGTQCERIVKDYGYTHLSAGDLLREEVKSESDVGKACATLMKEGALVPMHVTIQLLKNAMVKSGATNFLIDGFPRAVDQAEAFEKGIKKAKKVLFFDCPEETMRERLLKRGETSGRSDDNAEAIVKRFKTFVEQSLPVITKYDKRGIVAKISAVPGPEEVYEEVKKAPGARGAPGVRA